MLSGTVMKVKCHVTSPPCNVASGCGCTANPRSLNVTSCDIACRKLAVSVANGGPVIMGGCDHCKCMLVARHPDHMMALKKSSFIAGPLHSTTVAASLLNDRCGIPVH